MRPRWITGRRAPGCVVPAGSVNLYRSSRATIMWIDGGETPRSWLLLPGVEAVVVPLSNDLPVAEFEEHGEPGTHHAACGDRLEGHGERARPLEFMVVMHLRP